MYGTEAQLQAPGWPAPLSVCKAELAEALHPLRWGWELCGGDGRGAPVSPAPREGESGTACTTGSPLFRRLLVVVEKSPHTHKHEDHGQDEEPNEPAPRQTLERRNAIFGLGQTDPKAVDLGRCGDQGIQLLLGRDGVARLIGRLRQRRDNDGD